MYCYTLVSNCACVDFWYIIFLNIASTHQQCPSGSPPPSPVYPHVTRNLLPRIPPPKTPLWPVVVVSDAMSALYGRTWSRSFPLPFRL